MDAVQVRNTGSTQPLPQDPRIPARLLRAAAAGGFFMRHGRHASRSRTNCRVFSAVDYALPCPLCGKGSLPAAAIRSFRAGRHSAAASGTFLGAVDTLRCELGGRGTPRFTVDARKALSSPNGHGPRAAFRSPPARKGFTSGCAGPFPSPARQAFAESTANKSPPKQEQSLAVAVSEDPFRQRCGIDGI